MSDSSRSVAASGSSPTGAEDYGYDYSRLLDLVARLKICARDIDLSDRTAKGNKAAVWAAAQIARDAIELQEILRARQAEIEGQPRG